jgi:outer membrane protein TolC
LLLIPLLAGSGCVMFKPDLEPAQEAAELLLPETYSETGSAAASTQVWWADFNSADLDRMMGLALTRNFSVVQAEARMRQAEALAV